MNSCILAFVLFELTVMKFLFRVVLQHRVFMTYKADYQANLSDMKWMLRI